MIKPFLYIIFLFSFVSSAQNLVPNGSFEEYTQCPEQREYNNGQFERCKGWWYLTNYGIGTPDYYNVCNNFIGGSIQGMVGVPSNSRGYQIPVQGEGYVGFGAISVFYQNGQFSQYDGMEPVSCKLDTPLKTCHKYRFRCYLTLANISTHSVDKFGIVVSKDSLNLEYIEDVYSLTPNWETNISLVDTLNWTLLEGEFSSSGGEQYLTFGYFHSQEETNWNANDTVSLGFDGRFAYYFIDSISVVDVEEVENCIPKIPNVFTPNDDLFNDQYSIEGLNIPEMVILNRWGNLITTLTENHPSWDGTFEGKMCSEGDYFYRAKYGDTYLTGFITLIR